MTPATLLSCFSPAQANCSDRIADITLVRPVMETLWRQLKAETQYSWGAERPYGEINDNRITLTSAFEGLAGPQKTQVLERLHLGYGNNWFKLLSPQEQTDALKHPGIGALSPYKVYAHDGRLLSVPYDGCTRTTLMTEKARYSYYFLTLRTESTNDQKRVTSEMLRNAGQPQWRNVRFPITVAAERMTRLRFWQSVGYNQASQGWWIAWVPEQGHFEINVPADDQRLEKFWTIAPRQYKYVVVTADGMQRQIKQFDSTS
ncbi:MAG: phosphoribosylaminoimidazolesuccinocarboxamide synthase [Cyanobacteria bacterium P01_A01_bin.17]